MKARKVAFEVLQRITEEGAYANLALKDASGQLSEKEIPFLYALVYTALEHRSYVEYLLSHYCKRQKRAIRTMLLLGSSELLYLDTSPYAVIDAWVNLCKAIGKQAQAGFVNAVLRRIDRERNALPPLPADQMTRFSIQYGYPDWVVSEWVDAYGAENAEKLLSAKPSKTAVRAQFPYTDVQLEAQLPVIHHRGMLDPNCIYLDKGFPIEQSSLYRDGYMTVQNEGAMLICRSLGETRKKRVLDACAAPGGKTAYIASLSENDVDLTAWELHPHRKELMDRTFDRLHVAVNTLCRDAAVLHADAVDVYDVVLLDVPCSGLGLLGDKPDLRYRKTEADEAALVALQKQILNVCCSYVKPGGILVYATCTISRNENEWQVQNFLKAHPDFTLLSEKQYLPYRDGIDGFYHATMRRGTT